MRLTLAVTTPVTLCTVCPANGDRKELPLISVMLVASVVLSKLAKSNKPNSMGHSTGDILRAVKLLAKLNLLYALRYAADVHLQ